MQIKEQHPLKLARVFSIVGFLFCLSAKTFAAAIVLNSRDAIVWLNQQHISGKLDGFFAKQVTVQCNRRVFKLAVQKDSTFSFVVTLQKGENKIIAEAFDRAKKIASNVVTLALGYNPGPLIKPYAELKNGQLTLRAAVIENPWKEPLNYLWSDDLRNPSRTHIQNKKSKTTIVNLPSANGIYYFHLFVHSKKDTTRFATYVIKKASGIQPFDLERDHASWIDTAIVYEISPASFVANGTYDDIAAKLAEIKSLGINTVWLQPVYATARKGQGYDVTDYFSLREDLGTEDQLRNMIRQAKNLGLKVLFDFVPNHTSIQHPYAKDCIKYGKSSHYYKFYQHQNDGAAYSSFYQDTVGFVGYFWKDLVNLNYNNEEVQRWIIEACKYWVRGFGIDGYRFDAVWGVRARAPAFTKRLRTELKSINPDLLLLAEDKGSDPAVYRDGFDAAYDWAADTAWVSHWSWQYRYDPRKSFTVFNHPDVAKRTELLRKALRNDTALRLRFMENNDLPRFVKDHNPGVSRMAAALLFSLPGIPMLYNGQEIGQKAHPYSKHAVFEKEKSILSLDSVHWYPYYQSLIALRKKHPALQSSNFGSVTVSPDERFVAFRRWTAGEMFVIVLNLDSVPAKATIDLKEISGSKLQKKERQVEDVLVNQMFYPDENAVLKVPVDGYGIRWLWVK